ncbi:MAG: hypothetical protein QW734_06090, partial [Candidatus Bathyarchaeia archaeon]
MKAQEETTLKPDSEEIRRTAEALANIILDNNLHVQEATTIETVNLDLLASTTAGIFDPLGQLKEWLASTFNSVAGWITASVESWIATYVSPTVNAILSKAGDIWSALQKIGDVIREAVAVAIPSIAASVTSAIRPIVLDPIYGFIDWVGRQVDAFRRAAEGLGRALSAALSAAGDMASAITRIMPDLSKIGEAISRTLTGLGRIPDILGGILSTLGRIPETLSGILTALSRVPDMVSGILTALGQIPRMLSEIGTALGRIPKTISDIFTSLSKIPETVGGVLLSLGKVPEAVSGILTALSWVTRTVESVASALNRVPGMIGEITRILEQIPKRLGDFLDWLLKLPEKAPEIYTSITTRVWRDLVSPFFEAIRRDVVNPFTEKMKDITEKVSAGMTELGKDVTGFINAILKFPEWFPYWFRKDIVGEYFKTFEEKHLLKITGKPVKGSYTYEWWGGQFTIEEHPTSITSFMIPVAGLFQALTDPLGWIKATVIGALQEMANSIWSGLQWIWKWMTEAVTNVLKTVWESLKSLSIVLFTAGIGWSTSLMEFLSKTPEEVKEAFPKALSSYLSGMQQQMLEKLAPFHSEQLAKEIETMKISVPEYLTREKISRQLTLGYGYMLTAITMPFWGQIPARIVAYGLRGLARSMRDLDWTLGALLRPLGIGVETRFNLAKTIGASLYTFADQLLEWTKTIGAGLIYGYAIWLTQPMSRLISYHFRNLIPVQLPREDAVVEYARRSLSYTYGETPDKTVPTPGYKATLDISKFYMSLYGYSDEALRWFFSYQPEDWVDIKDRFDTTRFLPKSLVHELPSASEMARMMVRDMFKDPDQFAKAIQMRGMTRDTAYLYYMFHFRYPSPERLWAFTVRGVSGLLWATLTGDEMTEVTKEAQQLGAYIPKTAAELNYRYKELLSAFKLYMKWHDMARFSWIPGFTSDNLIYIDTLADIPSKIDQRWLVKWGIYEALSAKGVKPESPVSEFASKLLEDAPTSEVKLDLTNFCRTMQATGIHPYWVPATAVAETMNVLSDERTLLRTGFTNLFKEGFWDVKSLETLLAGLVTASFKVRYFDAVSMEWKQGWINLPVMFLPPERKLLELRAVMDRALDILRDIGRDVARAYSEWIITDYEAYKDKMTRITEKINTFFTEDYKTITGTELPEKLKLSFVEAYFKPYVEGLEVFREVFTIRRVRYWTARWLGYTVYRLATGVVKKEDALNLLAYVAEKAKLTPYEKDFIQGVMEKMLNIAAREYVPTPASLATLAEYVIVPEELVKKALNERLVPPEWHQVWLNYVRVRPIADDVKALLSTFRRALIYVEVPKEVEDEVKKYASLIGFTEEEWKILELRVRLEELIREASTLRTAYTPTPTTLATLAEYVPLSPEQVEKALEERRIPKEWAEAFSRYVYTRPIKADARALLSTYVRALRYGAVDKDEVDKYVKELPSYGFTQREVQLITRAMQLEEAIIEAKENMREYIPTPASLATIAEYVPKARELFNAVAAARRIPEEWRPVWESYVDVRPIINEVKRYLSMSEDLYVYFAVTEDAYKKVLEQVKAFGYTDKEVELMLASAKQERYLRAWREL